MVEAPEGPSWHCNSSGSHLARDRAIENLAQRGAVERNAPALITAVEQHSPRKAPDWRESSPEEANEASSASDQSATTTAATARPYAKSNRRFRFRVHLRREHVVLSP